MIHATPVFRTMPFLRAAAARGLAALLGFAVLLGSPAAAQRLSIEERLFAALDTAVKEHDVLLNCSATDAQAHRLIRRGWEDMVRDAIAALESEKIDAAVIQQFRERTDAEKLLKRDMRFGEMIAFCKGDWMDRAIKLNYLMLNARVREILAAK